MRHLFIVLIIFLAYSCTHSIVERNGKVLVDNSECRVVPAYPRINLSGGAVKADQMNKMLEDLNEMNQYAANWWAFFPEEFAGRKEISGNYDVIFASDSVLDFEYSIKFKGTPKNYLPECICQYS